MDLFAKPITSSNFWHAQPSIDVLDTQDLLNEHISGLLGSEFGGIEVFLEGQTVSLV